MPKNFFESILELLNNYYEAVAIFFGALLLVKLIEVYIVSRFEKFADKTVTDADNFLISVIKKIGWPFYIILALYFSSRTIADLPEKVMTIISYLAAIVSAWYVIKVLSMLVDYSLEKVANKYDKKGLTGIKTFSFLAKFIIWAFVLVLILSNLGYDLTSVITGLGVGGIAIGLALQNVLGDFFSGLSILFDKPFTIGDFIKIGDQFGTVKSIGIKTTRITLMNGPELIITNKDLTESRVHNFKKLKKRREVFTLGVTYDTRLKKLEKIPELVKQAFKGLKEVELDRVHLVELSDSSKTFEVAYYINSKEYKFFRDSHQKILLKIVELFEKEKIEFAFPTQTIHVKR